MMLHRHFEEQDNNLTKLADVTPKFVSEVFPPDEPAPEQPKRRGRTKKTEE